MFDLLIRRAFIIDGTGKDAYQADIALVGDRIALIGTICPETEAGRIINGEGLLLTPGFIDVHSHSDYTLLIDPRAESKIRQGITTEIVGNCGYAGAPLASPLLEERQKELEGLYHFSPDWRTFPEYLHKVKSSPLTLNYAFLAGYNTIRASMMGFTDSLPDAAQMARLEESILEAIDEGVFGLSLGLAYSPACFAQTEELTRWAGLVGRSGGILTTHIRDEGKEIFSALDEVMTIAERASIPLQISHLKTDGKANWSKLDKILEMIESATQRGLSTTFDRYPYTALQTGLQSLLPRWAIEGGSDAIIQRLIDPFIRHKLIEFISSEYPEEDFWASVFISSIAKNELQENEGKNLAELAAGEKKHPIEVAFDLLIEAKTEVEIILFSMSEENLIQLLKHPSSMIGSDSSSRAIDGPLRQGKPHPRAFGTFPRVLSEFWRKKRILSLGEVVRKMTAFPGQRFGLKDRGIIQEGKYADLVLFDPEKINDQATYQNPFQYPFGIKLVVINGKVAFEENLPVTIGYGRVLLKRK